MAALARLQPREPEPTFQQESEVSPVPQYRCYCTMLDRRSRFMRNGFRELPCDGTTCAARRQERESQSD